MAEATSNEAERKFMAAVRNQAEARMEMDLQSFAGYLAPEAMAQMRDQMGAQGRQRIAIPRPGAIARIEILEAECDGETGRSTVLYSGHGAFALRQQWKRTDAGWRVTSLERPPEYIKSPSLFQRLRSIPNPLSTVRMTRPPGGGGISRR